MRLPCLPRLPSLFVKLFIYIISTTFIKVMANMARGVLSREFIGSAPAGLRGKTWQCWLISLARIIYCHQSLYRFFQIAPINGALVHILELLSCRR